MIHHLTDCQNNNTPSSTKVRPFTVVLPGITIGENALIGAGSLTVADRPGDHAGGGRRDALHDNLARKGIGTVIHYPIPPHKQECYAREAWNTPQLSLPVTERIADEELSLPIGPAITLEEAAEVVRAVDSFDS